MEKICPRIKGYSHIRATLGKPTFHNLHNQKVMFKAHDKVCKNCNPVTQCISVSTVLFYFTKTQTICRNIQPICTKTSYNETSTSQTLQLAQSVQAHNHDNSQHNCLKGHHHHKPRQPTQQTQSTQPPQKKKTSKHHTTTSIASTTLTKANHHKPHGLKIHHKLHLQHNQHKHQTSRPQQPTNRTQPPLANLGNFSYWK